MGFLYRKFVGGCESELEDIQRNLGYILGAKRDGSAYFPDFGLSEPTHVTLEEALSQYACELRQTIGRYEPRVVVGEIDEVYSDDGRVSLQMGLTLRRTGERLDLAIEPKERQIRWKGADDAEDDM